MKKLFLSIVIILATLSVFPGHAFSADKVLFDFEESAEGWEIPDWAYEQDGYVAEEVVVSKDFSKTGNSSLKLTVDFPGGRWNSAIIEVAEFFDWTPFNTISCDVYLPSDGPNGLKSKIILTVGENWKWTEMSRSYNLKSGAWVTISANFKPGSADWKRVKPTDEFRADVRKVAVRVESNKPAYKGPIYIDNIALGE